MTRLSAWRPRVDDGQLVIGQVFFKIKTLVALLVFAGIAAAMGSPWAAILALAVIPLSVARAWAVARERADFSPASPAEPAPEPAADPVVPAVIAPHRPGRAARRARRPRRGSHLDV